MKSESTNGCSLCLRQRGVPPPERKGWEKEMKRTYVFKILFAAAAAAGILMVLGCAGASDLGLIGNGELFLRGGFGAFLAFAGTRGAMVCDRALEASRKAALRPARRGAKDCPTAA